MATYKTKDGTLSGVVPDIGEIVNGQITVPDGVIIENANLELVENQPVAPVAQPASQSPITPQAAPSPQADPVNKDSN